MRQLCAILALAVLLAGFGRPALANCEVIDQIDKLHALQSRLANDPDTALFPTDIRQLRIISRNITNQAALQAVDGNSFAGKGRSVVQLLQNTQNLLQSVSLDDPNSVRPHFTGAIRRNLADIGGHLNDLRCTDDQVAIAQAELAEDPTRANGDAEDIAQVVEVLNTLADEVFQWRTLFFLSVIAGVTSVVAPRIRNWLTLRRRRAKRHNTTYKTKYRWDEQVYEGPLLDINCFGTKLRHNKDAPIPQSDEIEILIGDDWHMATVMWGNLHYSGVEFSKAISLDQVAFVCDQS